MFTETRAQTHKRTQSRIDTVAEWQKLKQKTEYTRTHEKRRVANGANATRLLTAAELARGMTTTGCSRLQPDVGERARIAATT